MSAEAAEILWTPSPARREAAHLTSYMRWAEERHARTFADYEDLWRWSVGSLEDFWADIWERFGVRAERPYRDVLAERTMPGARWFTGAHVNYAENLLSGPAVAGSDALAVLHLSELRGAESITRAELERRVAAVAAGLRELGVGRGDRVVAYMPNIAETLIALLACASIGAIWSSAAPEFGARSVIDRFAQIEPRLLLAVDGYRYGGRDFDRREQREQIIGELPTLEAVVELPYLSAAADGDRSAKDATPRRLSWQQLERAGEGAAPSYEALPFDHPLWVLYSSGTTGLPKAIVHGHGGMLVEQLKKGHLHLDLHRDARMFWYTTTGWMMWNFLVGCLLTDAAIVLYDGSPAAPDGDMWALAERAGVTCLGTSAGYIAASMKESQATGAPPPRERCDLTRLRAVGSTGSPLAPEGFRWVYESVGEDLWLFSTSGGTDVCTAFLSGCPLLPVRAGELQCRALGCAVEAYDEDGHPLVDAVGELVVTEPMPSMPLYLWGDEGGERYRESYFAVYPGVWRHGDWIRITPRGSAIIYGRSDATINRGGVRMGTSEIYRAVTALREVTDALAVDLPDGEGGMRLLLFVVLRAGLGLDPPLAEAIRRRVREDCSPRHVPDDVVQIGAVPRTLSGKALEVPVKRILTGTPPAEAASRDSLANPEALEEFVRLAARLAQQPAA